MTTWQHDNMTTWQHDNMTTWQHENMTTNGENQLIQNVKLVAKISKRQKINEELEVSSKLQGIKRGGNRWDKTGSRIPDPGPNHCFRELINIVSPIIFGCSLRMRARPHLWGRAPIILGALQNQQALIHFPNLPPPTYLQHQLIPPPPPYLGQGGTTYPSTPFDMKSSIAASWPRDGHNITSGHYES